ncbi:hypothetical protein [Spirillospora albida]|uniref:hypothetical protein n=1 Tax=Spirillospora albida TaxID=58123 RepID=UPI001B8052F6|nr:hypothetical protein [Spirillospora albida]
MKLQISREKLADVIMHASQQAWGEAGWFKLANGDIIVAPGKDFVPDTFIIRTDGSVITRKTERWLDEENRMQIRYID